MADKSKERFDKHYETRRKFMLSKLKEVDAMGQVRMEVRSLLAEAFMAGSNAGYNLRKDQEND